MSDIYVKEHVTRSAAALSYYLTISIFPLLICASAILGSFKITERELLDVWEEIIPAAALGIISDFLKYVGGNLTTPMFIVGLGVMLTSSSAAFRTVMHIMGDLQGKKRFTGFFGQLASFILSLCFLAAVYAAGLVILTGEWFLGLLEKYFSTGDVAAAWLWIRFVLLFMILFAMFYGIYLVTAPRATKGTKRLPGALASAALIVIASTLFSRMISASAKYAIVYGSLASIIIMMTWIYTCATIFIMGNVLNISIARTVGSDGVPDGIKDD
ncbi:MAG: YihY/virulence factor BrkB family protein [Oscillospiraceae bacterium]|jgi:membrane protein|nr:YihY/virulence factor BrkB family protein [Oscillospiraceae bacterium]